MLSDEEVEALGMETATMAYAEPSHGMVRTGRVHLHRAELCNADPNPCALHSPSDHHMRDWEMVLRLDRAGLIERTCPHGLGHQDPDSLGWQIRGYRAVDKYGDPSEDFSWVGAHGCDGCCAERTADMEIVEIVNPECAQGKHYNCDQTALDPDTDEIIGCACDCHEVA